MKRRTYKQKTLYNKPYTNINDILEYSLQCNTRTDFRARFPGAYLLSRKLKLLDDVCKHMIIKSYSTPQLILNELLEKLFKIKSSYNNRKLIRPYEIDILFEELKIGFEYDGIRWHKEDKINKIELCNNFNY